MGKQVVVTLPGGLPLGFRLFALKDDERFYAVSKIRQHSKAEKSGLQVGDVVLCVNGISCEGLSHLAVTALTDISDMLSLLVLRNMKNPSEAVAAFTALIQSARHLNQKEIAELTGNQNLAVTRRQSTGCIAQTPQNDQHKQSQVKLFGAHKFKQTTFNHLPRNNSRERYRELKSDSEERKVEDGSKTLERRRRERICRTEKGSQKRHIIPERLKNISQTTEILEKELEEELRKECNLQMFEETSNKLVRSVESSKTPLINRNQRCASEEPRYKTNIQFNLSTQEIKQKQKVPTVQTKVSIRRFSLATPGEAPKNLESASQSAVLTSGATKSKLNITPIQMKPLTTPVASRRAQFSIRSNSIQGIPQNKEFQGGSTGRNVNSNATSVSHNQPLSMQATFKLHNKDTEVLNKADRSSQANVQTPNVQAEKTQEIRSPRLPQITSSSTKQRIVPATRLRSNSLSVISTARNPPKKFERTTPFSLQTGSNKTDIKSAYASNSLNNETNSQENSKHFDKNSLEKKSGNNQSVNLVNGHSMSHKTFKEHSSENMFTTGRNNLPDAIADKSLPTEELNLFKSDGPQITKERKFSFSSRSILSNQAPVTKMSSNAVKIENKTGTLSNKTLTRCSSVPPKEAEGFVTNPPHNLRSFAAAEQQFRVGNLDTQRDEPNDPSKVAPLGTYPSVTNSNINNFKLPGIKQNLSSSYCETKRSNLAPQTNFLHQRRAFAQKDTAFAQSHEHRTFPTEKSGHQNQISNQETFSVQQPVLTHQQRDVYFLKQQQPVSVSSKESDFTFLQPSNAFRQNAAFSYQQQPQGNTSQRSLYASQQVHSVSQPSTSLPQHSTHSYQRQAYTLQQPPHVSQPQPPKSTSQQVASNFHPTTRSFPDHTYLTPWQYQDIQQRSSTIQQHNNTTPVSSFPPARIQHSYLPFSHLPNRQLLSNINVGSRVQQWRPSSAKDKNESPIITLNQQLYERNRSEQVRPYFSYQQPSSFYKDLQSPTSPPYSSNSNFTQQSSYATLPRRYQNSEISNRSSSTSRVPSYTRSLQSSSYFPSPHQNTNIWQVGSSNLTPYDGRLYDHSKTN